MTATRSYDAFGMLVASTGMPQGPFGFAGEDGYQEDGDSGLKLLGHRYYDPSTGRFLSRDPAQDGRNWYGYCENNPQRWVDEDGLQTGKQNKKNSKYHGWEDKDVQDALEALTKKGKRTPEETKEKQDLQTEEKARGLRNIKKRDENYFKRTVVKRAIVTNVILFGGYEAIKWGIAVWLAPEIVGASLAGAAAMP